MRHAKQNIVITIAATVLSAPSGFLYSQTWVKETQATVSPCCCELDNGKVSKSEATYQIPHVSVHDQNETILALQDAFPDDRVIVMQFGFTSCSTICPVASGAMANVQAKLQKDSDRVAFVTISIDPEYDTSARLAAYAKNLGAVDGWRFLTGQPSTIAEVQKAFSAYVPNKSQHEALTFLRPAHSDRWIRLTGLISAARLSEEVQRLFTTPQLVNLSDHRDTESDATR